MERALWGGRVIEVRRLTVADLAAFRRLHRLGLECDPLSFVESVAEDASRPDADVVGPIERGEAWGAFDDGALIAKLTIDAPPFAALAHTRWLHGVVAHPESRGSGAARALVRAAIEAARSAGALRILLWVSAENVRARSFYEALGFHETGRAPGGIRFGERSIDDVIMCLCLDGAP